VSSSLEGSYIETCSWVASEFRAAEAKRSKINAFDIQYEGKTGLSTSEFARAA
jgi:hypothetical protein